MNDKGGWKMKELDKNRRSFLKTTGKGGGIALGATIVNSLPLNYASAAEGDQSNKLPYPFTLGIASGDPLPDGVVLWTRLAPDPLNGGGMPQRSVAVEWQIATDERMQQVVQRGAVLATPQLGHSVHVEVSGLQPSRWYYYQFKAGPDTT